ncbi:hypothetical protein EON67_08640 [archaeon]|nr:MAG: hypothetical protein EON67_08640 [archaeon]
MQDAFRHVDLEYVTAIAHACKAAGVRHFSLVSSMNADAGSWFLYPRTKGEAENAVKVRRCACACTCVTARLRASPAPLCVPTCACVCRRSSS